MALAPLQLPQGRLYFRSSYIADIISGTFPASLKRCFSDIKFFLILIKGDCTRTRCDNCSSAWSRERAASSTRYVYRGHGGQRGSRSQINKSVLYLSQTEALRRVELRVRLVRRRNIAAREKAKANEEKQEEEMRRQVRLEQMWLLIFFVKSTKKRIVVLCILISLCKIALFISDWSFFFVPCYQSGMT